MNNKAHLRPQDYDSNGDIIPMACKEEKSDLISREDLQYKFDNLCPHIECKKCRWYSRVDSFHKCALIDDAPTISPYKAIHDELHKGEEE